MCNIAINPSSIVTSQVGTSNWILINFSGTLSNSTTNNIKVTVTCAGQSNFGPVKISGNNWQAEVRIQCPCGTPATITATCNDTPPCSDSYTGVLMCTCCPGVSTNPICVEFDSSGNGVVKFTTRVNVPPGCLPVTVQRDFGDGTQGAQQTYSSSGSGWAYYTYPETHVYAPGHTYTSTINVVTPGGGCPGQQVTFTVDPPPPCSTNWLARLVCAIAHFLFLLYASVAVICFITSPNGCSAFNSWLIIIATGFALSAAVMLALLMLLCRKCKCKLIVELLGQVLLIVAVLLAMFLAPLSCFIISPYWLVLLVTVALFFGFLVLYGWFSGGCCPLTICDYWKAVNFAMLVAFAAVPMVFAIMLGGLSPLGLGIGMFLAYAILQTSNVQIGNNNCP